MSAVPRTILVTGATGCLGRAVVARLARGGHRVIAASRHATTHPGGFPERVLPVVMDVTRPETIDPALEGVDVVVHAAARIGDWGGREEFLSVIRDGTRNLVAACATRQLTRFVHVSSVLFYGLHGSGVMTEGMLPGHMTTPYAEGKVAAEEIVREAQRTDGLRAVILRPANFFGPGSQLFTERPADLLLRGLLALPPDSGKANVVYIENVAAAIAAVSFDDAAIGEVYNVVDDTALGWRELFGVYAEALGVGAVATRPTWLLRSLGACFEGWSHISGRAPLLTRDAVDFVRFRGTYAMGKLAEQLGHEREVAFDAALARTADYLRSRRRR
ncbi:MAG: NAD-dependent epimerase/dehydratase family protein [Polyangiaceae bacterium]|nr:NAD-dependent epimerase/dehydratase family protein [Polyangiaceae bacterium]